MNIIQLNNPTFSNNRYFDPQGIAPTLNTMQGGMRQPKILQRPRGKNEGGEKSLAPTMLANDYPNNNLVMNTVQEAVGCKAGRSNSFKASVAKTNEATGTIRRLTPVECERLQGFPDGWTRVEVNQTSRMGKYVGIQKYMADSQRYKQCGNAVTVNVVEAIAGRLTGHASDRGTLSIDACSRLCIE